MADGYLVRTNEGYYSHCDEVIERIKYIELDLLKESYEFSGIYCGRTQNYFAYRNYMANNPIVLNMGGGGDVWEDVIFGSGGAIDIHGKKIGVFGDSLFDGHEKYIKSTIEKLGGIPICKQKSGKSGKDCSLVAGKTFAYFNDSSNFDWGVFNGCDHIITDLAVNDMGQCWDQQCSWLRKHMPIANEKIKSVAPQARCHWWCCSPLYWGRLHYSKYDPQTYASINKNFGDRESKDTANKITECVIKAQIELCNSHNWHFCDSRNKEIYQKIWNKSVEAVEKPSKSNDGVHVVYLFYQEWLDTMFSITFGGGGGSNCPWTKEQLDKWRAEGTLSQNTGGRIRWDAARGVYQILTHRGYSGGSPTGGFLGAWSGALPDKVKRICELAMKGDFRAGGRSLNLSGWKKTHHGQCTAGPSTWYEDGAGITLRGHWWSKTTPTTFNDTKLEQAGMQCIWKGSKQEFMSKFDSNDQAKNNLRPSDVATLYTGTNGHQHGMMWTGQDWRSDFAQSHGWCYGGLGGSLDIAAAIWRHPDLWPAQSNGPSNTSNINYSGDLPRWIDTSYNARDLGGWPAANGRKVKSGIIFRGQGGLPMSKAQENGITCTINLNESRYTIDRKLKCYDTGNYHRPELQSSKTAGAIQFLIDQIRSGGKCYIHCARGMDRTGMFCGALLSALGVSENNVNKDYHSLKTTYRWTPNTGSAYQGGYYKGNIWTHFASKQSELQNLLLE